MKDIRPFYGAREPLPKARPKHFESRNRGIKKVARRDTGPFANEIPITLAVDGKRNCNREKNK